MFVHHQSKGGDSQSGKVNTESLLDLRTVRICGVDWFCPGDKPKGDRKRERGGKEEEREERESRQVDAGHSISLQAFIRQARFWIRTVYEFTQRSHLSRRSCRISSHQINLFPFADSRPRIFPMIFSDFNENCFRVTDIGVYELGGEILSHCVVKICHSRVYTLFRRIRRRWRSSQTTKIDATPQTTGCCNI